MSAVADSLAQCVQWREPRSDVANNPFRIGCTVGSPADRDEIERSWPGRTLPADILEAWSIAREARLFEDVDYAQWGLKILSPEDAAARTQSERAARPEDHEEGDIVLGEFLGDQELLVVDASGGVLVAMPLDPRSDWWRPAANLGEFLERYVAAHGAKYWESS